MSNEVQIVCDIDDKLELINGVLMYEDQPFSGSIESYFDSGKIKSKVFLNKGKKEGLETIWYPNDSVFSERYYKNGLKTGIHQAWWVNGNPKFLYHFNEKGEYHGNVKEWYETGTLFRDFNYVNRRETGSQRMWYITGKIKANYEVVNGERFGLIGLKKCYQVTVGSDEVNQNM